MPHPLTVQLGERSYPIVFGEGTELAAEIRAVLTRLRGQGRRVAVVTDRSVATAQRARLDALFVDLPLCVVEPGESSKSLAGLGRVLDFLAGGRLDRTSAVFALGGGVIGDLAGFAAASYLRGIDFYQVPTTLLAMVDSSVGGKTGINLDAGKNLVGAFHQPRGVFIDTGFLATLPPREFAAGMAEVIKTGLLGDLELFSRIESRPLGPSSAELPDLVRRCCALKATVVEGDERETRPDGGRALLNLGHTFGHAIEQVGGYGVLLHGEAVAIGLCAAARLSRDLGLLDARDASRVEAVVAAHDLPVRLARPLPVAALMEAMARDKKVRAGALRFVLLESLGRAVVRPDVPAPAVLAVWKEVGAGA